MILSYNDKVYHVSSVKVKLDNGKDLNKAVFQAREVPANTCCNLQFEIPRMLCDVLIEYAKIDNPDTILVVQIKNSRFSWNVLSEAWLKHSTNTQSAKSYVA